MNIPNLENLKGELSGRELELMERFLLDEDLIYRAFDTVDHLRHERLKSRGSKVESHLVSQIFEYFCYLYLSGKYNCLTPWQSYDIIGKTFQTRSAMTYPDGLSWTDGDGILWFDEYTKNHRNFKTNEKLGKYTSLFRFLSKGRSRHILDESLHEYGYDGSIDGFGLRLVIPQDDSTGINVAGRFEYKFEIDNCPIKLGTVKLASRAFVDDYPLYFNLARNQ